MQKVNIGIKITFVFLIIVIAGSCKALRVNKGRDTERLNLSEKILYKSTSAERPEDLLINNGTLRVKDENNMVIRTRVFIKRDEYIFISARYIGFELFRFMISNDSVKYINRVQRNYYFGKSSDVAKGVTNSLNITDIQELIYTGLYGIGELNRRNSLNNYKVENDRIIKETILDEGVKMNLEYDKEINLNQFTILDHSSSFYLKIDVVRNSNEVDALNGTLYLNNNDIEWSLDVKDIEYKAFEKTDFRIGKDYYELPRFL